MRLLAAATLLLVLSAPASAAGPAVPPSPAHFVTDKADVLSESTAERLEERLQSFEDETSNQFLVYLEKKVPEGTTLEEYTVACAQAWGVGQKDKRNGLVFFVFPEDKAARFEVGRGLEGALPDVLAGRIIFDRFIPLAKEGKWDEAVTDAVDGAIAATKGEYQGTGKKRDRGGRREQPFPWGLVFFLIFFVLPVLFGRRRRPYWYIGGGGFGGGGFGGFGGGGFGGGGGGFSGGGGSFGGGGASGRW